MRPNIRLLYLYLFSLIGLLIVSVGSIRLVQLFIKVYLFKDVDKYEYAISTSVTENPKISKEDLKKQTEEQQMIQVRENTRSRQREIAESAAMLLVGAPLYLYHWSIIKKENKK